MSDDSVEYSPAEFTQAAAQALAAHPDVEVIGIGDLTLKLRVGGRDVTGDLTSFYDLYRRSPDQLAAVQQALVAALTEPAPDRSEDDPLVLLDRALPMLKPLSLLSDLRERRLPLMAYRPLVGELMVAYVIDEGDRVVYITEEHLARWGVSEAALYRYALANLRAKSWQPQPGQVGSGASGLLIFNSGDGYDATRLLLPELFADFAAHTPGNIVIATPNRDFLIAFSDAAPAVFQRVQTQIEVDARTEANPLSAQLMTLRDGELQLYTGVARGVS